MGVHQVGIGTGLFFSLALWPWLLSYPLLAQFVTALLSTVYGNVINNNLNLVLFCLPEEKEGKSRLKIRICVEVTGVTGFL